LSPWLNDFNEKYILGSKFSSGAYSTVHFLEKKLISKVNSKNSINTRVVKLINSASNQHDRNCVFLLFSEIKILKMILKNNNFLYNDNIIEPRNNQLLELVDYGYSSIKNSYFLIFPKLEYLQQKQRGSSESLTVTNRFKFFTTSNDKNELNSVLRIIHKLILDIKYLHLKGITHFDIKADNIMYKTDKLGKKEPILIDYGESLFGDNNHRLRGTEYMKSPEMLINKFPQNQKHELSDSNIFER
jgi:serine/threonine protein kinase